MEIEEIVEAAQAQTGLTDIGDPAILEGLGILLKAYGEEAALTPRGLQRQHQKLIATLANRMRVEDWLKRHPEILEQPVDRPLFVFGLPRSGTTLTINLLHADPARRSLLHWEAFESVPPPTKEELHAGERYQRWQRITEMALEAVPHIAAIHHENADSPTECQFAMTQSFCAQVFEAEAYVPSYRHWLLHEADYMPAFSYEKRLLQLLQSKAPGRWTLKNPWHPLFLGALTSVFPDAQLVMTHRNPVDVVASCCSLIKHVRRIYSDQVDLKAIGEQFIDIFLVMIDRVVAYKEKYGEASIHDLHYADLMRDPIGEIRKVYAHFDEPFSTEAEAAMQKHLADNPQGKHGRHAYSLEEYGLSEGYVRERFQHYIDRFGIE